MKRKILVTGGLGYIGSHTVVELINNGFEVVIIDDLSNSYESVIDNIEKITGLRPKFYEFDLKNSVKTKQCFKENKFDGVIHFAASKSVEESVSMPLKYYRNNVGTMLNVVDSMLICGLKNIIFSSSCTVYGQPDVLPVSEEAPFKRAESPYGRTKQICEELLRDTASTNDEFYVIIDHLDVKRMKTSGKNSITCQLDLSEYKLLVSFLKKISKICYEDFGLKPVLHPHAGTYIENELEIENIINDVDSQYMGICIDTAHLYYCGVDVCQAIQKYSNLIMHIHFKDINQDVLNMVYNNNLDFDSAVKNQVFCPLGNGVIDFKKIINQLNNINYNGYATIEQDIDPNEGLDSINYAMKSLSYLEKLGCKKL